MKKKSTILSYILIATTITNHVMACPITIHNDLPKDSIRIINRNHQPSEKGYDTTLQPNEKTTFGSHTEHGLFTVILKKPIHVEQVACLKGQDIIIEASAIIHKKLPEHLTNLFLITTEE